ncbi:transcriptional regulator family: Fungal Specific TF [Trichoderma harzianum]|nr:transcriptional regulator family: Fungal Specific TF [Trichoderma harzianum]
MDQDEQATAEYVYTLYGASSSRPYHAVDAVDALCLLPLCFTTKARKAVLGPAGTESVFNALKSMDMDLPDLYDLVDIEGSLDLPSECDAFLPLPQNTASPATHQTLALDTSTFEPPALRPDTWTLEQDATPRQRQRRYAPRSRQGCLTCRARRKRCDIQHPICRTCTRVNAECRWPEKLQIPDFNSADKSLKNQNKTTSIRSDSEALSTQTNNINVSSATDAYLTALRTPNGKWKRTKKLGRRNYVCASAQPY